MEVEAGEGFAGGEAEVGDVEGAVVGGPVGRWLVGGGLLWGGALGGGGDGEGDEGEEKGAEHDRSIGGRQEGGPVVWPCGIDDDLRQRGMHHRETIAQWMKIPGWVGQLKRTAILAQHACVLSSNLRGICLYF